MQTNWGIESHSRQDEVEGVVWLFGLASRVHSLCELHVQLRMTVRS